MRADNSNTGKVFLQLVQASENAEFAAELRDYDGEDTVLLECYILAGQDGDAVTKTAEELGALQETEVETVMLYGDKYDRRCWGNTAQAWRDESGGVWLDEQIYEEVFC